MADTTDPDAARAIAGRATRCTHALGLDAHQRECDETTKHIATALRAVRAEGAALAIDRDSTGLAAALNEIRDTIQGYAWLLTTRGPYTWDDNRYKDEAGRCMRAVVDIVTKALRESGKRADDAERERRGRATPEVTSV